MPVFLFFCITLFFSQLAHGLHWERSGSAKSIVSMERLRHEGLYEKDTNYIGEERLRLASSVEGKAIRVEYAGETSLYWQRPNATTFPVPDLSPQSSWSAKWNLITGNEVYATHRIDRLSVQFNLDPVEVRVGKQVVATGVGQFFGAVAQTQHYPYIVVDPEYQKTEDAVSVIWSGPLQLEGRFLPKVGTQKEHNFHFRAKGSKGGYDVALTAGRSDDKPFLGLETAGNLSDALLRGEIVGYFLQAETVLQGLLGVDYVFSSKWSAKVEGFYNGFGKAKPYVFEPYRHRSAPYRGRWYGAVEVVWEPHPLWKIHSHFISNVEDPSLLLHLYLTYSLGNNLDLLLGNYQGFGNATAEFGGISPTGIPGVSLGYPDLSYAALRYYF